MSAPLTARLSQERHVELEGRPMRMLSYCIGERFFARAYDDSVGDLIGRGSGATRSEAESEALDAAGLRLGLSAVRSSLARSVQALEKK